MSRNTRETVSLAMTSSISVSHNDGQRKRKRDEDDDEDNIDADADHDASGYMDDDEEPFKFGTSVLPVANLPYSFEGVPQNGMEYLFTVRSVEIWVLISYVSFMELKGDFLGVKNEGCHW